MKFAVIEVVAKLVNQWCATVDLPESELKQLTDFGGTESVPRSVFFGLLDVLVTRPLRPLLGLHVRLVHIEIDPVESSELGFRMAGKRAAEQLIKGFRWF